jgi:hypothetical protein
MQTLCSRDFVQRHRAGNRSARNETERFRRFGVDEVLKRDKLNPDIFWLKDESLDDIDICLHPMRSLPRSSRTSRLRWRHFSGRARNLSGRR